MYASNSNFKVDRNQIAQQLELLGYVPGEKVFLRAFYPSDDPRKRGRKSEASDVESIAQAAEAFQNDGMGVYLVVNGGGQTDAEVKACRAVFFEHDNLDKKLQLTLWRRLQLPEPTFQVDTGGKSIHSYWVFHEPIDSNHWKALQTDLLEYSDGDRSLKNTSRVMRLAGCYHISAKGAYPTAIVTASGTRYRYEEIRQAVPTPKKKATTQPAPMPLTFDNVPLENCLPVEDRNLILNGFVEPGRNTAGAKLARSIIGASIRLPNLGYSYSGDPRQLFDNYCSRCSPPLDAKEADQVWKSAEGDNPTATLTDDAIHNCVKAWQRKQQAPRQGSVSSVNGGADTADVITELSLRTRIIEIIQRGLGQSAEKQAFILLAQNTHTPQKEVEELAKLIRLELEKEEFRGDRQQEIEDLLAAKSKVLDLARFLPSQIAEPVKLWCKWLNIRPEVALTAILAAASSLHPVETELVIHRSQEFSVPPTLFMAIVAESGQKKSPIFKTLIRKPLGRLQREANTIHERDMARYTTELAKWEKDPSNSSKPAKPGKPVFFFTESTGEGIKAQAQESPDKALFALVDEISGLFNSANQYRGGKGSDRQDMLSYYDGFGQTVLRASGIKVDVDRIYLSLFGGIQPKVLREHTRDLDDPDGHWARFLFVSQPLAAAEMHDDGSGVNITELLTGCYKQIADLGKREYTLSREAFQCYRKVYNHLEQKRVSHPQGGMRAIFSKMEGVIGRLALNLHAISLAVSGSVSSVSTPVDTEISLDTMNKAIDLAGFYMSEIKAIHAESAAEGGELSALLAKLLGIAVANGKLTGRDVRRASRAVKTSSQAVDLLRELESCGYGTLEKAKGFWVFIPQNKSSVSSVSTSVSGGADTSLPIYSKDSSSSVSSVSSVSIFPDFVEQPNTEVDKDLFNTNTESMDFDKETTKNADTADTADTCPETPTQGELSGVSSTVNAVLTPLTLDADGIEPNLLVLEEPISLMQVENDGSNPALYVGSEVEVRDHSTGKILSVGKMVDWDGRNAIASVSTGSSNMVEYVASRDLFVIALQV